MEDLLNSSAGWSIGLALIQTRQHQHNNSPHTLTKESCVMRQIKTVCTRISRSDTIARCDWASGREQASAWHRTQDLPTDRRETWLSLRGIIGLVLLLMTMLSSASAQTAPSSPTKVQRVLLLGQQPDGHAWSTHEYLAGMRILAATLQHVDGLQTIVVSADDPWEAGPELIESADTVVLFLSEGARWTQKDPARLAALQRLAKRGGGVIAIHWALGTRSAEFIPPYLQLVGGCHGGPDRKFKVVDVTLELATPEHAILQGITPLAVHEEFYYAMKFVKPADGLTPLIKVPIDGKPQTIAWAWDRPDGGRSFGFTGGHFHTNWNHVAYRRLITQAVLWSLERSIPASGVDVTIPSDVLRLPKQD